MFAKGRELGIPVFSTPFDDTAVDFLERFDPPAYKIASFELVDLPLVRRVAATGRPTIISTGMATPDEIAETVAAFRDAGGRDLVLLHCVSGYPTPAEQSNLRRIPALAAEFGCPVGLSDHTLGIEVAIASVALGACLIEKHFTLRRADGGPDASFSLEPDELAALVHGTKGAFEALGTGAPARSEVEKGNMMFRRSVYVVRDIAAGEPFTAQNVRVIRPGFGLAPKHLPDILGKRARRALRARHRAHLGRHRVKTVAIIQARMGSTRLPGKVLADLAGKPAIAWVVRAAHAAAGVDEVWVATSTAAADDPIAALVRGERCCRCIAAPSTTCSIAMPARRRPRKPTSWCASRPTVRCSIRR